MGSIEFEYNDVEMDVHFTDEGDVDEVRVGGVDIIGVLSDECWSRIENKMEDIEIPDPCNCSDPHCPCSGHKIGY